MNPIFQSRFVSPPQSEPIDEEYIRRKLEQRLKPHLLAFANKEIWRIELYGYSYENVEGYVEHRLVAIATKRDRSECNVGEFVLDADMGVSDFGLLRYRVPVPKTENVFAEMQFIPREIAIGNIGKEEAFLRGIEPNAKTIKVWERIS